MTSNRQPLAVRHWGTGRSCTSHLRWIGSLLLVACLVGWPGPDARAGDPEKVLLIRCLSVVEDPVRTRGPDGAWSFGRLMKELAPVGREAAFVKDWLMSWETPQDVHGFQIRPRPGIRSLVIDPWKRKDFATPLPPDEKWDPNFENAPFRLLAIVFRPDLATIDIGTGKVVRSAEGRFVFGAFDLSTRAPLRFTVIFEYELVAADVADLQAWGRVWNALDALPFGEAYNTALQKITDSFSRRGAAPTKPNGSALNQIRTNEIALQDPRVLPKDSFWELREFNLVAPAGGAAALTIVPVKQTPDRSLNGQPVLAAIINRNEAVIKDRKFLIPEAIQAGSATLPPKFFWKAEGVKSNQARHLLALGTCNGCHHVESGAKADAMQDDPIGFVHIGNRRPGQRANLSVFLIGGTVTDPVGGESRPFNDLEDRGKRLEELLSGQFSRFQSTGTQRAFRVH